MITLQLTHMQVAELRRIGRANGMSPAGLASMYVALSLIRAKAVRFSFLEPAFHDVSLTLGAPTGTRTRKRKARVWSANFRTPTRRPRAKKAEPKSRVKGRKNRS